MKAEKLMVLCRAPHFLAISLPLAFIAARCGFASRSAYSYEIAPEYSHSLIVLSSSVCFIISSLISVSSYALDFKGRTFNFQGKMRVFAAFLCVFCKKSLVFAISCFSLFPGFPSAENGMKIAFIN